MKFKSNTESNIFLIIISTSVWSILNKHISLEMIGKSPIFYVSIIKATPIIPQNNI